MSSQEESTGPVIRDRRRIDPATGHVRDSGRSGQAETSTRGPTAAGKSRPGKHAASKPGGSAGAGGSVGADGTAGAGGGTAASRRPPEAASDLSDKLAERTADLQRVTAEYANYRKRVERDRLAVREQALANVLYGLLPVLDDIGRAREHGELVGGFKSVAESLEAAMAKLGLDTFGEPGETFDPKVHEALTHAYSSDVTGPTCVQILQPGYRVGERILRPARVAVAEPEVAAAVPDGGEPDETGESNESDEHSEQGEPDAGSQQSSADPD